MNALLKLLTMFAPMLTRIRSARAIWRDLATKDNLEKRCDKGYHFSDPEAEPLCAPEQADSQSQPRANSLRLRAIPYIFHFVLVCIYTGIFLYSQRGREQCAKEKWNEIVQCKSCRFRESTKRYQLNDP